jgi:hypothetical protein
MKIKKNIRGKLNLETKLKSESIETRKLLNMIRTKHNILVRSKHMKKTNELQTIFVFKTHDSDMQEGKLVSVIES